jgi:hypothetical protein
VTDNQKDQVRSPGQYLLVTNRGLVAGIVAIAALLIIFIILMTFGYFSSGTTMPPEACAQQAVAYINTNLPPTTGGPATLVSVREQHDTYEITVLYNGRNTTVYAAKDCALLFTRAYTMNVSTGNVPAPVQAARTTAAVAVPQKSARPVVDLYVMSFCPFGVQAETAMKPVVALLGTKADFRVHYIATVRNSTLAGIQSLHGPEEAKEDLRQLCVMKYYPDRFWPYVEGINAQCYPGPRDPAVLDRCWRNVSSALGIDTGKVTSCAYSSEGIAMLREDAQIATEKRITGSPTLQTNNQTYAGQRTPEAFKQAVCDRFITPPPECATNLTGLQAGQVSGSCG